MWTESKKRDYAKGIGMHFHKIYQWKKICNNVKTIWSEWKKSEKSKCTKNELRTCVERFIIKTWLEFNELSLESDCSYMRQDIWIVTFEHNLNVSVSRALSKHN